MSNWKTTDNRIYQLLKHPYQIDKSIVEEMSSAYVDFVENLFDYLNNEKDNKDLIRDLNDIQVEFSTLKGLEEAIPTEHSKLKLVYINKILTLVNKETELVYHQMEYPRFFVNLESEWRSPFYINDDEIKLVDIMELVCGLYYLVGGIQRYDRKKLFLTDVAHIFEKMFNISLGDIHKKEEEIGRAHV